MQLNRAERYLRCDLVDVLTRLVDEDAHRNNCRRKRRHNRPGGFRIDEARAVRPEHESESARAAFDGEFCISQSRDSANLHQHDSPSSELWRGADTRTLGVARRATRKQVSKRLSGIIRSHEALADQKRVIPECPQP